ncbi:MAG: DUF1232 domain-containing protein [Anaerolineae bacterium]
MVWEGGGGGPPGPSLSLIGRIGREAQLVRRLLFDGRVPLWTKLILPGSLLYLLSPLDFISDPLLGLGQLDDLAVLVLGVRMFVALSPPEVVREHLQDLSTVAARYRIVDERERSSESESDVSGRRALEPAIDESKEAEDRG